MVSVPLILRFFAPRKDFSRHFVQLIDGASGRYQKSGQRRQRRLADVIPVRARYFPNHPVRAQHAELSADRYRASPAVLDAGRRQTIEQRLQIAIAESVHQKIPMDHLF